MFMRLTETKNFDLDLSGSWKVSKTIYSKLNGYDLYIIKILKKTCKRVTPCQIDQFSFLFLGYPSNYDQIWANS